MLHTGRDDRRNLRLGHTRQPVRIDVVLINRTTHKSPGWNESHSVTGVARIFVGGGGGTRPTPPSLASVVHTFEAVEGSRGSVSAPAVSRVMSGAPERNKNSKKYR